VSQVSKMGKKWRMLFLFLVLVMAVIPLGAGLALAATAYSVEWVGQFGSTTTEHIYGVAIDGLGYAYSAGDSSGAFNGQTNMGNQDAFVIQYNTTGSVEWTREFGTTFADRAMGVAADGSGNSYVAGDTYGSLVAGINYTGCDGFIRQYSSDGTAQWTDQFGADWHTYTEAVAADSAGNSYVVGQTYAVIYSVNINSYSGSGDAFIRKYNIDGAEQWTRLIGTTSTEYAYGVAVDDFGNPYVTGYTSGIFPGQTKTGVEDAWARKFDSDGNVVWTRQWGITSGNVEPTSIAVDSSGHAYVAGYNTRAFPGETASGSGSDKDAFVSKLNSTGTAVLWNRQFGSSVDDRAEGVAVDGSDNAFVAGRTLGALPGQTSLGGEDAFVREYDSSGFEQWTYQYGTMDGVNSAEDSAYGVATDGSGNVYTSGWTSGQFPGYPDNSYDGYVMKLVPPPVELPAQMWFLDNMSTGPVMEQTYGEQSGTVPLGGTTVTWLSEVAASSPVVFEAGKWTVHLSTTDLTGLCEITIGESDGAAFTVFDTATGTATEGALTILIDLGSVTVPQGHYLGLIISNSGTGNIITDGSSFLGAPSSDPSFPVPELAAGILLALGLAGLGGLILIRRRRVKATA
jgi:MYXO-CTERM domain-containing protein